MVARATSLTTAPTNYIHAFTAALLGLYAVQGPRALPESAILPSMELTATTVFFWLFLTKGKNSLVTRNTPTTFVSNSAVKSSAVLNDNQQTIP